MFEPASTGPDYDKTDPPAGIPAPEGRSGRATSLVTFIVCAVIVFFVVAGLRAVKSSAYSRASAAVYDTSAGLSLAKYALVAPQEPPTARPQKSKSYSDESLDYLKRAANEDPTPSNIRRYGTALLLFDKPGGRRVLSTVAAHLPVRGKPGFRPNAAAEETRLWELVYGQTPFRNSEVPQIIAQIRQRQLGWLGLSAERALYTRAALYPEAERATTLMEKNARDLIRLALLRALLSALGIAAWMVVGLNRILGEARERLGPRTTGNGSPASEKAPAGWYVPLATAFAAYMLLPELLRPLQLLIPVLAHPTAGNLSVLFYMQVAAYLPIIVCPLWLLQRATRASWRELRNRIGLRTSSVIADIGYGILGYLLIFPLQELATNVSESIFRRYRTPVNPIEIEMAHAHGHVQVGLLFLLAVLVGPLTEELMFRGVLLQALRTRWRDVTAVVVSSAIFAAVHPTLPAGFLTIWVLGIAFSMAALRRRSLLPSFCMHALYNGLILLTMLLTTSS
jgi:membrane protease YdiL (CAAX protease family)